MFQPCRGLIILQASCHSLVHQTGEEISIMAGEELLELVTIVLSAVSCTTQRRGGGGPTTKRLVIRENRRLDMSDFL